MCLRPVIHLMVIGAVLASAPAHAQPEAVHSLDWIAGGPVDALERDGNIVVIGGRFNAIAPRSLLTGGFVPFQTGNPNRRMCNPALISGQVRAIIRDGGLGWFVGGRFRRVGSTDRENLVHLRQDCTVDPAWTGIVTGDVNALALVSGVLYVGGSFPTAGQQGGGVAARNNLAAFSAASGTLLPWNPGADGAVNVIKIATSGTTTQIHVGGAFTQLAGQPRLRYGLVDASGVAGTLVADADNTVYALTLESTTGFGLPTRIWLGGDFLNVNSTPRERIAAFNATTGVVDAGFSTTVNNTVRAIGVVGTTVYLAGDFTQLGGVARNYVGAIAIGGATLPFNPDVDGPVNVMHADFGQVVIGGAFTRAGTTTRLHAAQFNVASTPATLSEWNPGFNAEVRALWVAGEIAAGGDFDAIGAHRRRNLAAINLDSGELLEWAPEVNGAVFGLALRGHTLYVGGAFTMIDGTVRNRLASFAAGSRALGLWNPNADAAVYDIVTSNDAVFVGGDFTLVGGASRTRLAALDPTSGNATAWTPPAVDDSVLALARDGGTLYVGGIFLNVGGLPAPSLVRIDTTTGLRDLTWTPAPNGGVRAICATSSAVYAGGVFTSAGGSARRNLAAFDRVTALATAWMPEPDDAVNALACDTTHVYAGGQFTTVGSSVSVQPRPRLAQLLAGATGPQASYATAFRARNLGVVFAVRRDMDGIMAGANSTPSTDEDEPVARLGFFAENFAGKPGRPLVPTVNVLTVAGQVILRWSPPVRGPRATAYLLDAGTAPGSSDIVSGIRVTSTQLQAFAPLGSYFVRIRAESPLGSGLASQELRFNVNPICSAPPEPPQQFRAVVTGNDVTFHWEPGPGERATSFRLEAGTFSGAADFTANILASAVTFNATAPTGVFYVRLRALGACGTSLPSNEVIVTPGGATAPPSAPLDFTASSTPSRTVSISWSSPVLGTATSYRLEAGSGVGMSDIAIFPTTSTSLQFANVPTGTYFLRVYAVGSGGTSPPSAEFILVVP